MPGTKRTLSSIRVAIAYLCVGFLAIAFTGAGLSMLFGAPVSPKNFPVVEIAGTLASGPEINSLGKSRYIRLTLKEYALRSFKIDGDAYYATKYPLMNDNLYKGDSVFLAVSPDDYKNNIEQYKESEYVLPVAVYQCYNREHVFLSLADYCKEANSDTGAGVICLIMGSGFGVALFFGLGQKKKR